jgi:hypothetical protein
MTNLKICKKCLINTICSKRFDENTLCENAYKEIKRYCLSKKNSNKECFDLKAMYGLIFENFYDF